MGLPRKLKNMMLFNEAASYQGEASSVTLPKLTRKLEEWRGAGMDAGVKIDMGMEAMEMEWQCGGIMRQVLRQFATPTVGGVMLRFAGAYQKDDDGGIDAIEIFVRGRHEEIDMGDAKPGEDTEFKVKTALSYFRLEWNGETIIEIDPLAMICIVDGVDVLLGQRLALGI